MALIPFKQALVRLGCRETKARELINRGLIIAFKMDHQTLIDSDSIDEYHRSLPRIQPKNITTGSSATGSANVFKGR
jgi:hypothetical protein